MVKREKQYTVSVKINFVEKYLPEPDSTPHPSVVP